jgi:beta,beta-carotene 9',10'-dioxygenase
MSTHAAAHQLGYRSLETEAAFEDLHVEGSLPHWLAGELLRLGPGKFDVGPAMLAHHFDGFGMLHRFGFADGRVSYRNAFIKTPMLREARASGTLAYSTYGTRSARTPAADDVWNVNANVNIAPLAGRDLAWTDGASVPIAFDAVTLAQSGIQTWDDALATLNCAGRPSSDRRRNSTAHWLYDHANGDAYNYFTDYTPGPGYNLFVVRNGTRKREPLAYLATDAAAYMHAFALTDRFVVLPESPCRADPAALAQGVPFGRALRWHDDRPMLFHIFAKADGTLVKTVEAPPGFIMHGINAFEQGDDIVFDAGVYRNSSHLDDLYLDPTLRPRGGKLAGQWVSELRAHATPTRCRIDVVRGTCVLEQLADVTIELPTLDFARFAGRDYRIAYAASISADGLFYDQLARVDVTTGDVRIWRELGHFPGEAVFVADPAANHDDAGVLLSVVLDTTAGHSYLAVLDAQTLDQRARVEVPHVIPFNFHGQFRSASARA